MPDDQGQQAQPAPEPTVGQLAAALQTEFAALRQQNAAVAQRVEQLARERAAQATPAPRQPTASDFMVMKENALAQLEANPLRTFAEVQNGAVEQAVQKARGEWQQELAQRDAAQRADYYRQSVLNQNPDIASRWTQVEGYVGWAQQNRPDLNFDQQVQLAVQATRDAMQKERDTWLQQATEEQRTRAMASMPTGGAFGAGPLAPSDLGEAEARQARYEMLVQRTSKAMRGAYRQAAGGSGQS